MEMRLSIVLRCRRRAGILGMVVTASKAATAGGSAFASWLCTARADEWRCWVLILDVCVEEDDFKGVRGGMPTGLDIVVVVVVVAAVVVGATRSDGGGDCGFCPGRTMDLLVVDCIGVSATTGREFCGEGLERRRVPILSDFDLEGRGEGGECCR